MSKENQAPAASQPRLVRSVAEMGALRLPPPVVLVPTMGALHAGHEKLIREARLLAGDDGTVVVSVFVNPTQFGPGEDFESYPRDLDTDLAVCSRAGADLVFQPAAGEMYADNASIELVERKLSQRLCGTSRPDHFAGVCTVVAKLFNIVDPDTAVFGKKDFQQLAIICRLVRDLNFRTVIHGVETVRESDGLAMSSRNLYLGKSEREQAPAIRRALLAADPALPAAEIVGSFRERLASGAPDGRIDYAELVDAETLEPIEEISARPALFAVAVYFGKTRLIDNRELNPPDTG